MDPNPTHPTADPTELVVDYPRGELRYRGSVLPIQPGSILFKTIGGLASAGAQGHSKEELFAAVWSMNFRRETHGQLIYVTIRRVRRILPVETIDGRYRFPRGFGVTVLGTAPDPSM
ncbi:MAG TPA: helix-turn-helix domain-containing protein, partial [Bdellovibrionota bacterium]|nr:helix-turn-helix domain-containing protein [Bdellovibrionota bacterium]